MRAEGRRRWSAYSSPGLGGVMCPCNRLGVVANVRACDTSARVLRGRISADADLVSPEGVATELRCLSPRARPLPDAMLALYGCRDRRVVVDGLSISGAELTGRTKPRDWRWNGRIYRTWELLRTANRRWYNQGLRGMKIREATEVCQATEIGLAETDATTNAGRIRQFAMCWDGVGRGTDGREGWRREKK
jgi:hypothetical protein